MWIYFHFGDVSRVGILSARTTTDLSVSFRFCCASREKNRINARERVTLFVREYQEIMCAINCFVQRWHIIRITAQKHKCSHGFKSIFFSFWRWFSMTFITNLIRIVTAASWFSLILFSFLFHFYFPFCSHAHHIDEEKAGPKLIRLIYVINQCRAIMYFTFSFCLEICHI